MKLPHTHSDLEVNYLTKGEIRYSHGSRIHSIRAGTMGLFWGGIPHRVEDFSPSSKKSLNDVEGIWMTIPLSWFLQWNLPNHLSTDLLKGEFIKCSASSQVFNNWCADYESRETTRLHILELELEAFMARLALNQASAASSSTTRNTKNRHHVERTITFLSSHYLEDISMNAVAHEVNLNPKYLMRSFKAQMKMTIWEYLTRLRITHAQRLLTTTDLKILDIALESGFGSLAPFYQAFSKYAPNINPVAYRKTYQLTSK